MLPSKVLNSEFAKYFFKKSQNIKNRIFHHKVTAGIFQVLNFGEKIFLITMR